MTIGVPRETFQGERRVALVPEGAKLLKDKGFDVAVQAGAGLGAGFVDEVYEAAGAEIVPDAKSLYAKADLVLKVNAPSADEACQLREGASLISQLYPTSIPDVVKKLAEGKVSAFALELVPRITRAQSMDVLSSMSTIAGYRGVLLAATHLPKFFPMFMTAAGTIPPARAFVIGAGVAGLQAIATCKRLGAIVEAFDVRPSVKEQVESLGGRFVELADAMQKEDASGYAKEASTDQQQAIRDMLAKKFQKTDVVITTALVPGRRAPILVTKEMLRGMPRGGVVVDLAAVAGGNCEATEPGKTVDFEGITIIGSTTLLSDMATDASRMFSRNMTEFMGNLAPEGQVVFDLEDEIIHDTLVTHEGAVRHEATKQLLEQGN